MILSSFQNMGWQHLLFSIGDYIENIICPVPGTHQFSVTVLCKCGGKLRKTGDVTGGAAERFTATLTIALLPGDSEPSYSGSWGRYLFSLIKPLKAYIIFLIPWDFQLVQKPVLTLLCCHHTLSLPSQVLAFSILSFICLFNKCLTPSMLDFLT